MDEDPATSVFTYEENLGHLETDLMTNKCIYLLLQNFVICQGEKKWFYWFLSIAATFFCEEFLLSFNGAADEVTEAFDYVPPMGWEAVGHDRREHGHLLARLYGAEKATRRLDQALGLMGLRVNPLVFARLLVVATALWHQNSAKTATVASRDTERLSGYCHLSRNDPSQHSRGASHSSPIGATALMPFCSPLEHGCGLRYSPPVVAVGK
ncbi:hypothetical protein Dimus_031135 [Dionaea muscipula]